LVKKNKQTDMTQWGAQIPQRVRRSGNVKNKPLNGKDIKEDEDCHKKEIRPEFDPEELQFHDEVKSKVTTYPQNWQAYNKAQTNELPMFQDILVNLLDSLIVSSKSNRQGRPFLDLKDMIFCCVMRAYDGKSIRRYVSSLDHALKKGFITKIPNFNTILNYYKETEMTPILKYLVEQSASPLKELELDFATDSSGFSTSLFGRWFDEREKPNQVRRLYKKAHIQVGVISNVIASIEVTPGYYADSPLLKDLLKTTAKTFKIREISADKAYSSRKNLQAIVDAGGIPFIPFKEGSRGTPRGSIIWSRMKRLYNEHRDYFMLHYHKRSNVESTFSMMKRKFGHKLRSRSEVGQVNEILCKALAHNICVLIQEYFENCAKLDFNYCAKMEVKR
jgi:transposase